MSIVSNYVSEEAAQALKRQQRVATASSIFVSVLVLVLIALVMALILLPAFRTTSPTIVAYNSNQPEEEEIKKPEMTNQVQRKPSAPSSSMARVIASASPSTVSVPVPDTDVPEPSLDFGDGDDFGEGWGSGSGSGSGGGGTTFFGQKSNAQLIAYVIDYSASMGGERDKLMRAELTKSLKQLHPDAKFQMIFFAGPAWVAGNEVKMKQNKTAEVKGGKGGHTYDWETKGGAHRWETKGKKQEPEWMQASDSQLKKSLEIVKNTKLVWGTTWEPALEMALRLDPPPQVIYFMTDGSAGPNSGRTAATIGAKAKRDGIVINTVALMQPKAEEALDDLAKRTGGAFTVVQQGGKVVKKR